MSPRVPARFLSTDYFQDSPKEQFWVLDGWGLRREARFQVLCSALARSTDRGVAAAAIGMLEPGPATSRRLVELASPATVHPVVRKAALLALTEQPPDPEAGAALARLALAEPPPVGHLATALKLAATRHPEGFLRQIVESGAALDDPRVAGTLVPPAFPPLAGSPVVAGPGATLVGIVLKGLAGEIVRGETRYDGVMPGHEGSLGDAGIADIVNYIRGSWGNVAYGDVTAADVAATRAALRDRREPFRPDELDAP